MTAQDRAALRASALKRAWITLVGILLIAAATVPARGGEVFLKDINGVDSGWKAAWALTNDPFVNIVVDMVTAVGPGTVGEVFIRKTAIFTRGLEPPGFPPIPIVFSQVSPDAVGRIIISNEIITNDTGVDWTGFQFRLLPRSRAAFNPTLTNPSGEGTGFSTAPFNNQTFSPDNGSLFVDGFGLAPSGSNASVPDASQWFPGDGVNGGGLVIDVVTGPAEQFTVFTLKENPSIPEPATLWLAAFGAAVFRPRRRSH